jgi:hypothetical protein
VKRCWCAQSNLTLSLDDEFGVYIIDFNCGAGHGAVHSFGHDLFLCSFVSLLPRMIRRNPTLIAMSDADVQDVRNMLAKKQAEGVKSPNSSANVKSRQCPPPQPPAAAVHVTDEAKRRREAREERLGVTN